MRKCTKGLFLLMGFSLFAFSGDGEGSFLARYHVNVSGERLGQLLIRSGLEGFEAHYFGALSERGLPFYSKRKKASFASGPFLKTMDFDDLSFRFYHIEDKLEDFPPMVLDAIKGDKRDHSVITDEEGLPRYTFDRIPSGSLDHLLVAIIRGELLPQQHFMVFEAGSRTIFRAYLQEMGMSSPPGENCKARQLACMRTSVPGQENSIVFDLWLSDQGIPFRVKSRSNRWSFDLAGFSYGPHGQIIEVASLKPDVLDGVLKSRLKDLGMGDQVELTWQKIQREGGRNVSDLTLKSTVQMIPIGAQLSQYMRQQILQGGVAQVKKNIPWKDTGDSYQITVTSDEAAAYRWQWLKGMNKTRSAGATGGRREKVTKIGFSDFVKVVGDKFPDCDLKVEPRDGKLEKALVVTCDGEPDESKPSLLMLAQNYLEITDAEGDLVSAELRRSDYRSDDFDVFLKVKSTRSTPSFSEKELREGALLLICSQICKGKPIQKVLELIAPWVKRSEKGFAFSVSKVALDQKVRIEYERSKIAEFKNVLSKVKDLVPGEPQLTPDPNQQGFTLSFPCAFSIDDLLLEKNLEILIKKKHPQLESIWNDELVVKKDDYWDVLNVEGYSDVHSDCL